MAHRLLRGSQCGYTTESKDGVEAGGERATPDHTGFLLGGPEAHEEQRSQFPSQVPKSGCEVSTIMETNPFNKCLLMSKQCFPGQPGIVVERMIRGSDDFMQ